MKDPKLPSRKTVVTRVEIIHRQCKPSEAVSPFAALTGEEALTEIWNVNFWTRSGRLPERIFLSLPCRTAGDAKNVAAIYPKGSTIPAQLDPMLSAGSNRDYIEKKIDEGAPLEIGIAGPKNSQFFSLLPWFVLKAADILDADLEVSQTVLDFLGIHRLDALQSRFGDKWQWVAAFQYCWSKLPRSSPAYIAAAHWYHYFITRDHFSAGYLLRDLEILVDGDEAKALKAIDMEKRAGEAGGKRSRGARDRRIAALLEAMEAVAKENPGLAHLGLTEAMKDVALEKCRGQTLACGNKGQAKLMNT